MAKIDDLIRDALDEKDREMMKETDELGYFELGLSQFSGKLGWVTWVIMIVQATLFFIGVWCAYNFFGTTEVLAAVKWGISGGVLIIVAASLKFSLMPQIQADRIIREVKRVELMLASRS
ncbi:hypothetical protein SAMN05444003_1605 [Cognatiyoonia sediminum]|uniref:Uncharacterized protein n=1 Tax=Cognatiyoonia sediminum TaxID=1508389 RepID=A0A1M5NWD8_9RHOB|nr:DUF6768 family protein [Cognatiyoonia sediminum]SHG93293.1 hypothetical protein SAMN05444003_1605 [Cognatiyoonia sediminum]